MDRGQRVRRVAKDSDGLTAGDFLVETASGPALAQIAPSTGIDFAPLQTIPTDTPAVRRLRIGMYQRYWGGNMDEGWTRFLLEQFSFPYASLLDAELKKGDLNAKFDVIILPDDSTFMMTGDTADQTEGGSGDRGAMNRLREESYPPEYRSGFGKEGTEALKQFVEKGGTLVALGRATDFAIKKFELPIRNVLANRPAKEFFCPGSTLRARFDTKHRMAWGMPAEGLVLFFYSPVFEIVPNQFNERYEVVARYADAEILQSGWLIGGDALAGKAAMISAQSGQGKIVLIGFRTQHRAQTHGTFKLLFNALIG
jgi:hypothetical protein